MVLSPIPSFPPLLCCSKLKRDVPCGINLKESTGGFFAENKPRIATSLLIYTDLLSIKEKGVLISLLNNIFS